MARAYRTSQLIYVGAKLGIADRLVGGARTCEELSESLQVSGDALCRLMRGLVSIGVVELDADGRYTLGELGQPMLSTGDESVRAGILYVGGEQYQAWGRLLQTITTGKPAFRSLFGDPFDYYDEHPEYGETFDSWMAIASANFAESISFGYEFPDEGVIVDVGGGEGVLLAAVLGPRPGLRGVLLDRASVAVKARRVLTEAGVADRCTLVAGDFREAVPPGGDVYILKNVLHDWDDEGALSILRACRQAMPAGSRLIIVQRTMPEDASNPGLLRSMVEADLMQLVYSGGRERTLGEYGALLASAGLGLSLSMQDGGTTWLMEARRTEEGC
jgi:hypothetical protein